MVGIVSYGCTEKNYYVLYAKREFYCYKDFPLLSADDVKDWLCFNMSKEITELDKPKLKRTIVSMIRAIFI